jgi:predicted nucleotidyltransferase component of viral defense system
MSDPALPDDDRPADIVDVDVRSWVEEASANPTLHRDRQVTEILLAAIGLSKNLKDVLILKGGTLMALAFSSDRVTSDVDFTATEGPDTFPQRLVDELNSRLPRAAIELGYLDVIAQVQSVRMKPRPQDFAGHDFPAMRVRIGSARRGTAEEKRLADGQASRVLNVDVSFKDQVYSYQELRLAEAGVAVRAFSLHELIAEKFRALLQQPGRDRFRRQDVYDIALLAEQCELGDEDRAIIHAIMVEKCQTRGIEPNSASIDDPEVRRRAEADWLTLGIELAALPAFEARFAIVRDLYRALPWRA